MPSRRMLAAGTVAAAAILVALVLVGRWERHRWVRSQVHGMERVRAAIGPLDSASLVGYRVLPAFDCLVYRRGSNPYALELCFDSTGRVVQAIDRRTKRTYFTLQSEPGASTFRVDGAEVTRLLRRMGAFRT